MEVYHGSPKGDLKEITAHKSTHQKECIYATDNLVVALLFMGKGNGDLDTRLSSKDKIPELVERRSGVLEKLYNKEGYLYVLDGATFSHQPYLWSLEMISFEKKLVPFKKIFYPNILKAIEEEEKQGNLILYRYPKRPADMPSDNSDLIDKYINFEKRGLKGSIEYLLKIYPEFSLQVKEKI